MSKLKVLSGKDVINFLKKYHFIFDRQQGSHVTLKRRLDKTTNTITVPNHQTLDRGTTHSLFKEAALYIDREKVIDFFYIQ